MAEWVKSRGFKSRIVERKFDGDLRLTDDLQVALCGVDNLTARAAIDEGGFSLLSKPGSARVQTNMSLLGFTTFPLQPKEDECHVLSALYFHI